MIRYHIKQMEKEKDYMKRIISILFIVCICVNYSYAKLYISDVDLYIHNIDILSSSIPDKCKILEEKKIYNSGYNDIFSLTNDEIKDFFLNAKYNNERPVQAEFPYSNGCEVKGIIKINEKDKAFFTIDYYGIGNLVINNKYYPVVCEDRMCKFCSMSDDIGYLVEALESGNKISQKELKWLKSYGTKYCVNNTIVQESNYYIFNIYKIFESSYFLNISNNDIKSTIRKTFYNSFLLNNPNNNMESNKIIIDIEQQYKILNETTLNNSEKIYYTNLLELSKIYLGKDIKLTNVDKYSADDFYLKYRIKLFEFYIFVINNKQNSVEEIYNEMKKDLEKYSSMMMTDFKTGKIQYDYYNLYNNTLESLYNYYIYHYYAK